METRKTLLICITVLLVGAATTLLVFWLEPKATRSSAVKESAMLVETITVQRGDFRPTIQSVGTVRPSRDIVLSPRVGGEVVSLSPSFVPGGYVKKGDVLLHIETVDYRSALQDKRSELSEARAQLSVEMGRQNVAKKDYALLNGVIPEGNEDLVLRKPQLEAAEARVKAGRAGVAMAEKDLDRATIRSPFDAHILSRSVNVGSQVSPGAHLGRLVGKETYWVEATVPLSKLRWLDIPESDGDPGSRVLVRHRTAWELGMVREGTLYRLVGALEDGTRMARVLVSVSDPHAQSPEHAGLPRLMLGSYVEASIEATLLKDVVRLSRDHTRKDDTVWVMNNGALEIRLLDIVFEDADYAYVAGGLSTGDRVVITNLSTVTEGAPLRVERLGDL